MNIKEGFLVTTACSARKLLKLGYIIIDIKPDRQDNTKTVFIFKREKDIEKIIYQLK